MILYMNIEGPFPNHNAVSKCNYVRIHVSVIGIVLALLYAIGCHIKPMNMLQIWE